jgi:selenophosphate synthetase-related protein
MDHEVKRAICHMFETNLVRKVFWHMDEKVEGLTYGIRQGDDAIVVGDTVINMEGPYPLKIGRKTGLIHTCSDIVVMGGKPLYALDSMQVSNMKEAEEVCEDIKKQSDGLGVPIVGGNTQMEDLLLPCVSFVVVGKIINKPIPDSGMQSGDRVFMVGEVVEGETGERVQRARTKFETLIAMVEGRVEIHAAKDCSRGGWFGNLSEMLVKSRKGISITSIPYPSIGRYMGNYLLSVPENEMKRVIDIAARHKCPAVDMGKVNEEFTVSVGGEEYVDRKTMEELITDFPFKKPKI